MNTSSLKHLTSMEQLDAATIRDILSTASTFLDDTIANNKQLDLLKGKVVANLFFESSTRTRNSFQIAAERLGAIVLNPDMSTSALTKGESLLDTIHTFEAMGVSAFVIRHADNGIMQWVADNLKTDAAIINAGEGWRQHPTQALLDLLTISQHKSAWSTLSVAIVGDLRHSRVARSLVDGLVTMGVKDIRLIAPEALLPEDTLWEGAKLVTNLVTGLKEADVVVTLRLQKERMVEQHFVDETQFHQAFGLTPETLSHAKADAIVMHPGPMNRNVEISPQVADGNQSVILHQVRNGVAIRMAILSILLR